GQQGQAGLAEPGTRGEVDVQCAGQGRRVGVQQRSEAREVGGTVEHPVQPPELLPDARRQLCMVVRRGPFQVHRVEQRLRPDAGDGIVKTVEARQLAAEQYHRCARRRAGARRRRSQAAMRSGDKDYPAGQRAGGDGVGNGHFCPASLRIRASSPESASSPMTSLPPISSPCRNSCGNVGQLEKRGRLARISGSSSTLTTCTSFAPAACSACTARAEKPHIGYSAVPFMNSTTGWLSTRAWIRSRTDIASPAAGTA